MMDDLLLKIFSQFSQYTSLTLFLELTAVILGLMSVIYAKQQNILVYPIGIISTGIYFYLLYQQKLWGNMMINGYYTMLSLYGWYLWAKKVNGSQSLNITDATFKDWLLASILFLIALLLIAVIYHFSNTLNLNIVTFLDMLTTAIFFSAMVFMAKKIIEHWLLWIIGDVISIPMYINNHLYFSALQFFVLTLIAIGAYSKWKKDHHQVKQF